MGSWRRARLAVEPTICWRRWREAVVGLARVAAELSEDGGGVVHDLGALVDRAADTALQLGEVGDTVGGLGQEGEVDAQVGDGVADAAGEAEGGLDVEELGGLEDVAAGGLADGLTDVASGAEGEVGLEVEGAAALGGEALTAQDLAIVGGGPEVAAEAAGGGEGAEGRQPVDDLVVLQGAQRLGGYHGSSLAETKGTLAFFSVEGPLDHERR
jgi:hypothetical protein